MVSYHVSKIDCGNDVTQLAVSSRRAEEVLAMFSVFDRRLLVVSNFFDSVFSEHKVDFISGLNCKPST